MIDYVRQKPRGDGLRGKVCHMTSVHHINDVRVFHKECVTLAAAGFDVTLIGVAAEVPNSAVNIVPLPDEGSRLRRILGRARTAYHRALAVGAEIYHFHDTELLPYGLMLKRRTGAKVIFDSHECFREDVQTKDWLPEFSRPMVGALVGTVEDYVVSRIDQVITATPHIAETFSGHAKRVDVINNYPMLSEFNYGHEQNSEKNDICYVGALSFVRGVVQLLDSLNYVDKRVKLHIAGRFADKDIEAAAKTHENWNRVIFHGQVGRSEVVDIYGQCFAGMATLLKSPNHIKSKPIKIFEYMAAGLPVICSDFPLWREVVNGGKCGVVVDPTAPEQIGRIVEELRLDPVRRAEMAECGRMLAHSRYNWESEGSRLVEIYDALLAD